MRLWLDAEKLAAHQLTVLDVERSVRQQNVELPSGRVENLSRELTIQTRGEMKTPEEFNQLVLRSDGAKRVRLRDIGEARAGVENERTIARNNGCPCIFLGVVKQSKANTVQVADAIKAEVERLKPSLSHGIEMVFNYDESIYVSSAITEVRQSLVLAIGVVVDDAIVVLENIHRHIEAGLKPMEAAWSG